MSHPSLGFQPQEPGGSEKSRPLEARVIHNGRASWRLLSVPPCFTLSDYSYADIRWGERFVDIYEEGEGGRLQVDCGRIHDTEPVPLVDPPRNV